MPALARINPWLPVPPSPSGVGWRWAGSCRSALEVGGDVYEVLPLSQTSILVLIADVMGKGLPAALFADSLRTLTRALAGPEVDPAELLAELNHLMFAELSDASVFITAQVAVADLAHRRLQLASAGHCPLLLCDQRGRIGAISPNGMPLGVEADAGYQPETVLLPPLGAALFYTDGITEARDAQGRFLGQDWLEAWFSLGVRQSLPAAHLKADLLARLSAFQGSAQGADDQTFLLCVDETPRAGGLDTFPTAVCGVSQQSVPWIPGCATRD